MIRIQPELTYPRKNMRYGIGVLVLLLFLTGLIRLGMDVTRQRQLRGELQLLQEQLDAFETHTLPRPLHQQLMVERARYQQLEREWDALLPLIQRFRQQILEEMVPRNPEGRIDFIIALMESRQRLEALAREHITVLPPHMGIPDSIGASEESGTRLGQLAATLRILETCIRQDIPIIQEVQVLPPKKRPFQKLEGQVLTLFPVYVNLECSFDELVSLLNDVHSQDLLFTLHHLHVESRFPEDPERLRVHAVWNAAGLSLPDLSEGEYFDEAYLDDEDFPDDDFLPMEDY